MYKDGRHINDNRRYRASKGVTEDVTKTKGVTRVEVTRRDIPEFARVLPETTINGILAVLHNRAVKGLLDDAEGRWERAVTYYERTGLAYE